jgi:hypothetical protein
LRFAARELEKEGKRASSLSDTCAKESAMESWRGQGAMAVQMSRTTYSGLLGRGGHGTTE